VKFDLSDDQRTIASTARELLAARSPFERVRSVAGEGRYDDALWRELCELGWPGIAIAERYGGQGLGAVELAVLLEELGYAVASVPLLGSALAASAIEHAGDSEQRARWLPGLASGELTGAFGGVRDLIADAAGASVIVLVEAGAPRVVARADAEIEPVDAIDPTRRHARVSGEGPPLAGDVGAALGGGGGGVLGLPDPAPDVLAVAGEVADHDVGVGHEVLQHRVLAGEDRKHPVGLAQRGAAATDRGVEIVGAAADAGTELVEDDPQALSVGQAQDVVEQVRRDRGGGLRDGNAPAGGQPLCGGAGPAVDEVLADQRLRARLAERVLAQRAEALLGHLELDERTLGLAVDVQGRDLARTHAGDLHVAAFDEPERVVELDREAVARLLLGAGGREDVRGGRGEKEGDGKDPSHVSRPGALGLDRS